MMMMMCVSEDGRMRGGKEDKGNEEGVGKILNEYKENPSLIFFFSPKSVQLIVVTNLMVNEKKIFFLFVPLFVFVLSFVRSLVCLFVCFSSS